MPEGKRWRFPGNNYTADNGLDTADMETFKKDAISSLAREVCQNSIDASNNNDEPVKIEFHSFTIDKNDIPGRNEIENQIEACLETWSNHSKISKQLKNMLEQIRKNKITCLRISDFNTTGLIGVSGEDNTPWHYLVHGSGLSDKSPTSGGSKGIGKFATFVTSYFNTVFYSTKTIQGEIGYEGVCKLCSAKIQDSKEKTQGIGYYGSNDRNTPITEDELMLDKNFYRKPDEFGSDIFIIGFKNSESWKKDIISKALDSFMVAIIFNSLEIIVDDIIINSKTIKDIIFNENYTNKNIRKSIISQYFLLTDTEHRFECIIPVREYGNAKLYLMEFTNDMEQYATNNCVMVRYPYMKIKELTHITSLPCSALCIIENNELNRIFRDIENPQHTDWEFNRIEDTAERREIQSIYKELRDQIIENIKKYLTNNDDTKTDLEGAGEYLPNINTESIGSDKDNKLKIIDKPNIRKNKVKAKNINLNATIKDPLGDGAQFENMNSDDNSNKITPSGNNNDTGADIHNGDEINEGSPDINGHKGLKQVELREMEYRFFCQNKINKAYSVVFVSDFDVEKACFELYSLDEAGNKDPVFIESCKINGIDGEILDYRQIQLSIKKGQKYHISMITDQDELFSGEIKMYAYR